MVAEQIGGGRGYKGIATEQNGAVKWAEAGPDVEKDDVVAVRVLEGRGELARSVDAPEVTRLAA